MQFLEVGVAVKLEGVVHDAAVIQGHDLQRGARVGVDGLLLSGVGNGGLLRWLRLRDFCVIWLKVLHG